MKKWYLLKKKNAEFIKPFLVLFYCADVLALKKKKKKRAKRKVEAASVLHNIASINLIKEGFYERAFVAYFLSFEESN